MMTAWSRQRKRQINGLPAAVSLARHVRIHEGGLIAITTAAIAPTATPASTIASATAATETARKSTAWEAAAEAPTEAAAIASAASAIATTTTAVNPLLQLLEVANLFHLPLHPSSLISFSIVIVVVVAPPVVPIPLSGVRRYTGQNRSQRLFYGR
jgi:hypothetical protein